MEHNDRYQAVSIDKINDHTVKIIVLDKATGELKVTDYK